MRLTPRALAEAVRCGGPIYERAELRIPVRRVLMPRTLNHVYYAVEGSDITVLSVWGAIQSTDPNL